MHKGTNKYTHINDLEAIDLTTIVAGTVFWEWITGVEGAYEVRVIRNNSGVMPRNIWMRGAVLLQRQNETHGGKGACRTLPQPKKR